MANDEARGLFRFGHWSLGIGHWSLVIGHWTLVIPTGHSDQNFKFEISDLIGGPMYLEHAERKRDLRLRRRLLLLMHAARVRPESGWIGGRFLVDVIDGAAGGT